MKPIDKLTVPALVDTYAQVRAERIAVGKAHADLKTREGLLKQELITRMLKTKQHALASTGYVARKEREMIPVASDWSKLQAHIKLTGNFELLQRRLTKTAVQERWDAGETIPGVEPFPVDDISITKLA